MACLTRRTLIAGILASAATGSPGARARTRPTRTSSLMVHDNTPSHKISPLIFGSNEIGAMDGGELSAVLDRAAGITARRLGGNLMTGYNWVNNAAHAGKDYRHSNGAFLLDALKIPKSEWQRPAVVIEAMHRASLSMGARSFVTVPLGKHVAGDFGGTVSLADAAPSRRFTPVRWKSEAQAGDPVNPDVADIPHLLRRLIATYGEASSSRGISGYLLDNEPGLWGQNHPRLFPTKTRIKAFIERSISVARIIKSIDPYALICGPGSWGATGMASLQSAPDWSRYKRNGSFLATYLEAFARASEQDGKRLLDVLDVHWYPFSARGNLFRTVDPALDRARLDAPRSLIEQGFRENSWVPRALPGGSPGGLSLPILPSLQNLIVDRFPDTKLAVTEFNYGGAKSLASALALADALGSYCSANVYLATHWGSLPDWLGQSYRLFATKDASGAAFGGTNLPIENSARPNVSAYAAKNGRMYQLVVINKSTRTVGLDIAFSSGEKRRLIGVLGLDKGNTKVSSLAETATGVNAGLRLSVPARSIRRYAIA